MTMSRVHKDNNGHTCVQHVLDAVLPKPCTLNPVITELSGNATLISPVLQNTSLTQP